MVADLPLTCKPDAFNTPKSLIENVVIAYVLLTISREPVGVRRIYLFTFVAPVDVLVNFSTSAKPVPPCVLAAVICNPAPVVVGGVYATFNWPEIVPPDVVIAVFALSKAALARPKAPLANDWADEILVFCVTSTPLIVLIDDVIGCIA